jgi:hypothetical protein
MRPPMVDPPSPQKANCPHGRILIKPSGVSLLARLIVVELATLPNLGAYPVSLLCGSHKSLFYFYVRKYI